MQVKIQLFKIFYKINFVSGVLKDLSYVSDIVYPLSSLERVMREMEEDIRTQRVIKGTSSNYVISEYRVEILPVEMKEI